MSRVDGLLIKSKLLEWLGRLKTMYEQHGGGHECAINTVVTAIQSGTFDLLPKDVEKKCTCSISNWESLKCPIHFASTDVSKRCELCPSDEETCYCYDNKPSVDVTYLESTLSMMRYNLANGTQEITNDEAVSLIDDIRALRSKLAEKEAEIERLKKSKERALSSHRWLEGQLSQAEIKLNQAEEALEKVKLLAETENADAFPTEKLETIVGEALQSIKGDDNDSVPGR